MGVPTLTNTFRHSRRSRKGRTPLSIGFPRGRAAAMMYKACQFFTSSTMPTWPPMRIAVRNAWSLERAVVTPRRGALASGAQSCVMMPHAIHLTQVQGNVAAQVLVPSLTKWNTRRSRKWLLTTVLTVRPQLAVGSQRAKVAATMHLACQSITSSSITTRQIARRSASSLGPAVGTLQHGVQVSGAQSGVRIRHALHLTRVRDNVAAQVLVPTLGNTIQDRSRMRLLRI